MRKMDIAIDESGAVTLVADKTFELNHKSSIADMSMSEDRILTGGNDARGLLWQFLQPANVDDGSSKPLRSLVGHGNALKCVFIRGK